MSQELTDEAVMLAVRGGDVGKLSILFERYHSCLFDLFCRMNGNHTASEDLVQDVFFRILQYRDSFREGGSFKSWMYQVARNARYQYFRKHPLAVADPNRETSEPQVTSNPGKKLEKDQAIRDIQSALLKLPEDRRELLILVWYQELRYHEIAELLGIEVGTVKVRVHRAVKELREIYMKGPVKKYYAM